MTTKDKTAHRRLPPLELAQKPSNMSRARREMGCSRQRLCEISCNFRTHGANGLIDRLPGASGRHPNRVSEETGQAVLDHARQHRCDEALRVERELRLKAVPVPAAGCAATGGAARIATPAIDPFLQISVRRPVPVQGRELVPD